MEEGTAVAAEDGDCISTQAWCFDECLDNPAMLNVTTKLERLVGLPWSVSLLTITSGIALLRREIRSISCRR